MVPIQQDSPDKVIQENGYPEIVPGRPVFLDTCREPITRNSSGRRGQVQRWCTERTARACLSSSKRQHHLRTCRHSGERYTSTMPKVQLTWEAGVGQYALLPSDIQLPSPPPSMSFNATPTFVADWLPTVFFVIQNMAGCTRS